MFSKLLSLTQSIMSTSERTRAQMKKEEEEEESVEQEQNNIKERRKRRRKTENNNNTALAETEIQTKTKPILERLFVKKEEDEYFQLIELPNSFEKLKEYTCQVLGFPFPYNSHRLQLHIKLLNPSTIIDHRSFAFIRDSEQLQVGMKRLPPSIDCSRRSGKERKHQRELKYISC